MKVIYPLLSYTAALKESCQHFMKEEKSFHRRPSLQSKKTNLTNFMSYFPKTPLDDVALGTIDFSIFLSVRLNVASQVL